MAPLTWRNVDAPNFSGVNDMYRTAATLMNQGIESARQGIADFQKTTTQEQSAALMQRVIAAGGDPAAQQAALAGANPAYLSPEALKFTNAQPGVLLEREGQGLSNTGQGLNNQVQGQRIRENDFDFGTKQVDRQREDANYALMPDALGSLSTMRADLASGDPARIAAANAAMPDFAAKYGQAMGLKDANDVGRLIAGNMQTEQAGLDLNNARLGNAIKMDGFLKANDAKGLAQSVLASVGNDPELAIKAAQNMSDMPLEMRASVIEQIGAFSKALPAQDAGDIALRNADIALGRAGPRAMPGSMRDLPAVPTTQDPNTQRALDLIAPQGRSNSLLGLLDKHEGAGSYSTLYGHAQKRGQFAGVDVSKMSVGEVMQFSSRQGAYGAAMQRQGVAAAPVGRFQVINSTLRNVVQELGIDPNTPFDANTQNRIFNHLADRRLAKGGSMANKMSEMRNEWEGFKNVPDQVLSAAISSYESGNKGAFSEAVNYEQDDARIPNGEAIRGYLADQDYTAPIDLNRPRLQNEDGSVSTEQTITIKKDDKWLNIPTIVGGKRLSDAQAEEAYDKGENPPVGRFSTQEAAENYGVERSAEIGRRMMQEAVAPSGSATAVAGTEAAATTMATPVQTTVAAADAAPIPVDRPVPNVTAVDPQATKFVQDIQQMQRNGDIQGAITRIKDRVATGDGDMAAGAFGSRAMSSAWDYFTASPEEAAKNDVAREASSKALDFFNSDATKAFLRENPDQLAVAAADPIKFSVENAGIAKSQQKAVAASRNQVREEPAQAAPDGEAQLARALMGKEAVADSFSALRALSDADSSSDTQGSVTNAIRGATESGKKTISAVINDLAEGSLKGYDKGEITQAMQRLVKAQPGLNPAVAGVLLENNPDYSGGFLGFGKGFDVDLDGALQQWKNYQDETKGAAGSNGAVERLVTEDRKKATNAQLETVAKNYQAQEDALTAAIANPEISAAKKEDLKDRLQAIRLKAKAELGEIYRKGNLTPNLNTRTGR